MNVFPFVIWVRFDGIQRVASAVSIDTCNDEHVVLGVDAPRIEQCEWPLQCRNEYESPQVDYLETTLQKTGTSPGGR